MANIEDLPFVDKASFESWAVERIKNVFLSLERTKNIKLTLTSYRLRTTSDQDYCYIIFKYNYKSKNNEIKENISDFSTDEIEELFDEEHLWPVLEELMPKSRWMQLKKRLATNDYVELCLAGWIFTIYTNDINRG